MDDKYVHGGGPPPQMMNYFPGYNVPQGPIESSGSGANNRSSNSVSIWAGDLDAYMDETFLRQAVTASGWGPDITRIKVVRDHYSGMHAGYGFLDAASPEAAQRVITTGSGMPIPGTNRCWRLNMGRNAAAAAAATQVPSGTESNVYVGNLELSVTDYQLMTAFRPRYASVRHAKVVCNEYGQSRGFGFVRFGNPLDAERAIVEMQGFVFNQKPIRLSPASGRSRHSSSSGGGHISHAHNQTGGRSAHGSYPQQPGNILSSSTHKRPRQLMSPDDPNNTTLFIGGTAAHITEELLWREFSTFGELDAVRVPVNKTGFAFVRFRSRDQAQRAKDEVSRTHFVSLNPAKPVRVEWASEQINAQRSPLSSAFHGHEPHVSSFDSQFSTYPEIPDLKKRPSLERSDPNVTPNDFFVSADDSNALQGEQIKVVKSLNVKPTVPSGGGEGVHCERDAPSSVEDARSGNMGIEPPSKRVAVGRPEYADNRSDKSGAVNASAGTDQKNGVDEESPAMQFSWLNGSSTPSSGQ